MATAKVTPFVVPAQFPSKAAPITQTELALFISLRGRLHQLETQVEAAEASIRQRLEQRGVVEEGDHSAELKEHFRANVAWKEKAIDLAERLGLNGQAWAQNVLTHTTKTRTISLVVE